MEYLHALLATVWPKTSIKSFVDGATKMLKIQSDVYGIIGTAA